MLNEKITSPVAVECLVTWLIDEGDDRSDRVPKKIREFNRSIIKKEETVAVSKAA